MNNDADTPAVANPIVVVEDVDNDGNGRIRENKTKSSKNGQSPQLLSPSPRSHPRENVTPRETLASDIATPLANTQKSEIQQLRPTPPLELHINNYTQADSMRF